jgi:hypothetical protein
LLVAWRARGTQIGFDAMVPDDPNTVISSLHRHGLLLGIKS